MVIHPGNHGASDAVAAFCLDYRMRHIERNAASGNLCRMNPVASDAGRRVDDCSHLAARLHQLERDNESDVSGADHQNLLPRLNALQIHERLRRAGADDSRRIPSLERNHVFGGTGRNDDFIRFVMIYLFAVPDRHFFIIVNAHDG